ncbi:uncharacterized protein LOC133801514 [Humulus lupulus]|uniref:uncharacterized protein LOC133801514 n=1 Tax=Humulus lupulus TaxID=3486 RepID=UPI002B417537|nr:uncharacterized protein LOC133801514 [Humulus lupulus]
MADSQSGREEKVSPATAVLLGALAPGVNAPTWNALKSAFVMLGLSLVVMMILAITSSDSFMALHVALLVIITATLFALLSWFLAETGLVSIESQMQDMNLVPNDKDNKKKA